MTKSGPMAATTPIGSRSVRALCRSLHNALYADAEIMPMLVSRSLFLAEIAGKGLA